jgi:putative hydrolase of the HAD superfamily
VKYKFLFFDLDHTLWDYHANATKALTQLYHKFDIESYFESPAEFITLFNQHNDTLWEDYRQGNIKKEELRYKRFRDTFGEKGLNNNELTVEIGDIYMEITPRLNTLFPNALDTLEYLAPRGYEMYILTNGFLKTQEIKLENAGIDKFFKRIFSSDELGINKPHKDFFHWVISSLHANKKDCLMIGDDEKVDVGGAKSYGIDSVWFNSIDRSQSEKAILTISDLSQLKTFL